tara:strand:+ start:3220 stop:3447 length:228 start_codon:yes stop_codon:yes gene_type:complete
MNRDKCYDEKYLTRIRYRLAYYKKHRDKLQEQSRKLYYKKNYEIDNPPSKRKYLSRKHDYPPLKKVLKNITLTFD